MLILLIAPLMSTNLKYLCDTIDTSDTPIDFNKITTLIIINGKTYHEELAMMLPTGLEMMVQTKLRLMEQNPETVIRGLIIIPPNHNLLDGLNQFITNQLYIIAECIDVVLFGNSDTKINLDLFGQFIESSKSLFAGPKFLASIIYRHFTENGYQDFLTKKEINNTYEKFPCDNKLLCGFANELMYTEKMNRITFEISKKSNVYDNDDKLIANYASYTVHEGKDYFIAFKTIWTPAQCLNIIHRLLKRFTVNYSEDLAKKLTSDIASNFQDKSYVCATELVFNQIYNMSFETILNFYRHHVNRGGQQITITH